MSKDDFKYEPNMKPPRMAELNVVPSGGGSVLKGGTFQSPNFITGKAGWKLEADGSAEFGNLQSNNFTEGKEGYRLKTTGEVEFGTLFFNRQFIYTVFESLDGWSQSTTGTGAITLYLGSLYLKTGATNNSNAELKNDNLSILPLELDSKNSILEYGLKIPVLTGDNYIAYFGVGDLNGSLGGNDEGYGFKVVNDTLYALYSVVGGETLTEITGITLSDFNIYRIFYSFDDKKLYFYVNGELKTTIETVFTGNVEGRFYLYIECTNSVNREIYIAHALFGQDR